MAALTGLSSGGVAVDNWQLHFPDRRKPRRYDCSVTQGGPRLADSAVADDLHNAYRRRRRKELPWLIEKRILIALREKPLKTFEIMKRVNIRHQDDCQSLLLKMRDDGAVKFDIHKGHWLASWGWATDAACLRRPDVSNIIQRRIAVCANRTKHGRPKSGSFSGRPRSDAPVLGHSIEPHVGGWLRLWTYRTASYDRRPIQTS